MNLKNLIVSLASLLTVACGPAFTSTGPTGTGPAPDSSGDAAPVMTAAPDSAPPVVCVQSLSNIGERDFKIAFDLTTTDLMFEGIANQRIGCDATGHYWDIELTASGGLVFTANNGDGSPITLESGDTVTTGMPHHIVFERVDGQLFYYDDGVIRGAVVNLPDLGTLLNGLVSGSDECPGTTHAYGVGTVCISVSP